MCLGENRVIPKIQLYKEKTKQNKQTNMNMQELCSDFSKELCIG